MPHIRCVNKSVKSVHKGVGGVGVGESEHEEVVTRNHQQRR